MQSDDWSQNVQIGRSGLVCTRDPGSVCSWGVGEYWERAVRTLATGRFQQVAHTTTATPTAAGLKRQGQTATKEQTQAQKQKQKDNADQ